MAFSLNPFGIVLTQADKPAARKALAESAAMAYIDANDLCSLLA
jgi:hypothetical protein